MKEKEYPRLSSVTADTAVTRPVFISDMREAHGKTNFIKVTMADSTGTIGIMMMKEAIDAPSLLRPNRC